MPKKEAGFAQPGTVAGEAGLGADVSADFGGRTEGLLQQSSKIRHTDCTSVYSTSSTHKVENNRSQNEKRFLSLGVKCCVVSLDKASSDDIHEQYYLGKGKEKVHISTKDHYEYMWTAVEKHGGETAGEKIRLDPQLTAPFKCYVVLCSSSGKYSSHPTTSNVLW